jgi:hypothetical protein
MHTCRCSKDIHEFWPSAQTIRFCMNNNLQFSQLYIRVLCFNQDISQYEIWDTPLKLPHTLLQHIPPPLSLHILPNFFLLRRDNFTKRFFGPINQCGGNNLMLSSSSLEIYYNCTQWRMRILKMWTRVRPLTPYPNAYALQVA